MWIFSATGFLSVVELQPRRKYDQATKTTTLTDIYADQLGENYVPADDKTLCSHLMVRARVKADLDALIKYQTEEYGEAPLFKESKTADYQYRVIALREAVALFLMGQVQEIDYDSHVKETLNTRAPKPEAGNRYSALYAVWTAFSKLQPNPPYGGFTTTGYGNTTGSSWSGGGTGSSYGKAQTNTYKPAASTLYGAGAANDDPKGLSVSEIVDGNLVKDADGNWVDINADLDLSALYQGDIFDGIDDPFVNMKDWEVCVQLGEYSRTTMLEQVKEFLSNSGEQADPDGVVEILEEQNGTCDVEKLEFEDLIFAIKKSQETIGGKSDV